MWERCLSLDSIASKVRLVVDRQVLGEGEYRREEDEYRPANLSLQLGYNLYLAKYPVKISNLVSWEEAEWTEKRCSSLSSILNPRSSIS